MSLLGFERALADFAATPDLCRAVISGSRDVFRHYHLTSQERSRLEQMVSDPLFAANCVLYRVNRITPLYLFFPLTCQALGEHLRQEVDAFWSSYPCADLQYLNETRRFVRFLRNRVKGGFVTNEAGRSLEHESALMELRFTS